MPDGSIPPITNALVPAEFRDAMLTFLGEVRAEIERARSVTAVTTTAVIAQEAEDSEDIATVLRDYVDNPLCEQVNRLDSMIECIEAQEVYSDAAAGPAVSAKQEH